MQLKTVEQVASQISKMKEGERYRAPQRKLLNDFFNGESPWTKQEAQDNHILINFNDKQGTNLLRQARNQYENAFSKRDSFFKVSLPDCTDDMADQYGSIITQEMNRIIKNSREYYYTMDEVWGGIVLHGPGMRVWDDPKAWRPRFAGIQDVLIPTETHLSMDNLQCFALRRRMRPGQLFKKTLALGKNIHPGWNTKAVRQLLNEYKDLNQNPNNYNWMDNPERMGEIWKQSSGGYYDSDVAPTIDFWDFYHREEGLNERKPGWYCKLLLDRDCFATGAVTGDKAPEFIFDSGQPVADNVSQIIHFQFGDGNNVPPFMYHSIRSLAYLTYDLVWTMNRLNCQFTQHLFEQLMTMVRVQDPADRGRISKVVLTPPFCIIPDGLNLVAGNERYKADAALLESGMAQYRQRISDLTSAYTQQLDTGTAKERTKFEVQAILAQTSALMSSMLSRAYHQEHWCCVEIARRFAIPDSPDFDVKKFQNECLKKGVPKKYIKASEWQIEVEQVLGGGNRAMELAEATELFSNLGAFDPSAQQEIKHDWALAVTNNPKKAARLAPLEQKLKQSASVVDAENKWGSLWVGADLNPVEGMNHVEQVGVLMNLMQRELQKIMQLGKPPEESDLRGFSNVAVFIAKNIKLISMDQKTAPLAKQMTKDLGDLMNMVKQVSANVNPPGQQNGEADAETMAKVQAIQATTAAKIQAQQATTATKLQSKQMSDQQKLQQKQMTHQQKLVQSGQSHDLAEQLKAMSAENDEKLKALQTQNDIILERLKALSAPKPEAVGRES